MQELKSWTLTLAAELAMEFLLGLLVGFQQLLETGDLSQAALTALLVGVCTATIRTAIKKLIEYIKKLKEGK